MKIPNEIFIQWRDKTHEAEHEFRGNSFRVSDTDAKYTRNDSPNHLVISAEALDGMRISEMVFNPLDEHAWAKNKGYNAAIDHLLQLIIKGS